MKIRLVDKTTHEITRAEIIDGRLEIDFSGKTAEEVEEICSVPANFEEIELLADSGEVFSDGIKGWTVYGGTLLLDGKTTAIMTKAANVTEERLAAAEANALAAKTATEEQAKDIEELKKPGRRWRRWSRPGTVCGDRGSGEGKCAGAVGRRGS